MGCSVAAEEVAVAAPKPYSNPANRPSYGSGQVDEVWANAQQNGNYGDSLLNALNYNW